MTTSLRIMCFAATCSIATCLVLFSCGLLTGCSSQDDSSTNNATEQAQPAEPEQNQEQDSITAHGSTYEKAETVKATTTLSGELKSIAVDEWLKNPSELDVISDESSLQAIAPDDDNITFTQEGAKIEWQANGEDVRYSGITDKELPFGITYTYKLNGQEVDPSALKNVTGTLEVGISYANNTSATVQASGSSHNVKEPFAMASLVSFDAEHAKNVKVSNGKVMDQDGSFIAIGMGMPGLAKTLELENVIELPESTTITADVTGFDMPDITTMASNQILGMIDEESTESIDSKVNDLVSQASSIQEATDQLSQGMQQVSQALSMVSEGQTKLNSAFPNATDGLDKIAEGTQGVGKLLDVSSQQLQAVQASQEKAAAAVAQLEAIDTAGMSKEQAAALEESTSEAKKNLSQAQQAAAAASAALEKASETNAQLSSGLASVSEGLAKIQAGYEQLGTATAQISEASTKLVSGTQAMSSGISSALSELQGGINNKLDLISAVRDYANSKGAFCGNASNMPASTTFIITAKADA